MLLKNRLIFDPLDIFASHGHLCKLFTPSWFGGRIYLLWPPSSNMWADNPVYSGRQCHRRWLAGVKTDDISKGLLSAILECDSSEPFVPDSEHLRQCFLQLREMENFSSNKDAPQFAS